jgi:phage protein D
MPQSGSNAVQSARPSFEVDGQDEPALAGDLADLCVVETSIGLYRCEARFANWGPRPGGGTGFLRSDRRVLDFGKRLVVKIGGQPVFDGRITALEGIFPEGAPPEINVYAEDRLQDLRMTRRTRTFENVSDQDVFQRIAEEHGLFTDLSVSGPTHPVLAQLNQSDLAFLRDRARAAGVEIWVEGRTLKAKNRPDRAGQPVTLTYGKELAEAAILADLAEQRSSVVVGGWDVSGKQAISESAGGAALGSEAGSDTTGGSLLQSSGLGQRVESLAHRAPLSSAEARAFAEAHYRARARRFVVLRGRAEADARLRAGAAVTLSGVGDLYDGRYSLTEVRHVFDPRGLRTEITAERPGLGQPRS